MENNLIQDVWMAECAAAEAAALEAAWAAGQAAAADAFLESAVSSGPEQTAADQGLRLLAVIEAIVYVTEEPVTAKQIADAIGEPVKTVQEAIGQLIARAASDGCGIAIREVAGGYKMGTKPEFHEEIRSFVKKQKPPLKLSLAALETLAVIAYKQPVTAPEIGDIRGVQGTGVLKTLLDRKLIAVAGRKNVVGKPVLYKTTKDFLSQFGLRDLAELPTLKEFEEWSRLAIPDVEEPAPPAPENSATAASAE